jgi:hypothetical protein
VSSLPSHVHALPSPEEVTMTAPRSLDELIDDAGWKLHRHRRRGTSVELERHLADALQASLTDDEADRYLQDLVHRHLANIVQVDRLLPEDETQSYRVTEAMAELLLGAIRARAYEEEALRELLTDAIVVAAEVLPTLGPAA